MSPETTLAFGGAAHAELHRHLFPADGLEAAALLICTRTPGPRRRLLVRNVLLVPYDACKRRARDAIIWPGEYVEQAIDRAAMRRDRRRRSGHCAVMPVNTCRLSR